MTRDDAKKLLPVIQAFAEGKDIESRCDSSVPWMRETYPSWSPRNEYRIKPDPVEFWITVDRDGDSRLHKTEDEAKHVSLMGDFGPYTIHHMREVIE